MPGKTFVRLLPLLVAFAGCRAPGIPPAERFPAGTPYEAKFITVDGTRIRYIDVAGTGGRGTVIFVHGLAASMYSWRHNIGPAAAAGYRVIAFDNRGFGFSDRPRSGYSNADYARLLVALMDSLGVPDAVLVGHSMGGAIVAEVALALPGRVRGLVLVGAAGYGAHPPFVLRLARWPIVGAVVTGLRGRASTAGLLRAMFADPAKVTEQDVDQYYAPVATGDYGPALRRVLRDFRFDTLRQRLGTLEIPTLAVWGQHDRIVPVAVGRALASELLRVAFFVVPDAGHNVHEESPDDVNRLLVAFLTQGLPRVPENLAD